MNEGQDIEWGILRDYMDGSSLIERVLKNGPFWAGSES